MGEGKGYGEERREERGKRSGGRRRGGRGWERVRGT